ncbi:MAG: DUF1801 domain-containing protein [Pseudomonadota bacterium]
MSTNKTVKTGATVSGFLATVDNAQRRADCRAVMKIMREVTGKRAAMWGPSIIGFGSYHYTYDSGREGDMCLTGVSPRKQNLAVYIMPGFERYGALLKKLGKHKTGRSCLYLNRLDDVDAAVLRKLIERAVADMRKKYGDG